ncbi:MAG: heavy-metal-associated domain-containing protein [Bacteroides sp.]|nr:heavy-metal-associated domain-containing protein [Bacteroides sp.]
MRNIFLSFLLVTGCLSLYAKDIKEYVVTTTPPMSCQNCENRIKGNLRFEKGVKKIETDLEHQRVTVTYDADKTTETNLEEAFGKLNYQVTKIEEGDAAASPAQGKSECCKNKSECKDKSDCKKESDCKDKSKSNDNTSECCKTKK